MLVIEFIKICPTISSINMKMVLLTYASYLIYNGVSNNLF